MSDEGFHEIQLNGKQLVFLFMAATVVSVVIFLLGVMVGRGVPSSRVRAAEVADATTVDPTVADAEPASASVAVNAERTPVSTQESLTYAERLSAPTPIAEPVATEPVKETVVEVPPPPPPVAAKEPPAAAATKAQTPSTGFPEPTGNGHVVQVGAYPRPTAETIARRLSSKGYPVFISPRPQGLFAVRVGKYTDKREADAVATRLEQQEQFNKPWVTR